MRESASFLEGKIPKAPCGHERNFGVFRSLRISHGGLTFLHCKVLNVPLPRVGRNTFTDPQEIGETRPN